MLPIIEEAILGTDLDCQFNDLLNVKALIPVPVNLAQIDDPRLTDERPPAAGSVTNESVADDAAIVQSKLNLNGQIPTAWLGTTATTAAQGDLAEYLSNKNQPSGYAGLDGSGKIPAAQLPATTGTGTVTSVGLTMPSQFSVAGSPITGAGTFAVSWASVADLSWFGRNAGSSGPPQFYTTPIPPALVPDLDASKVTTGVIDVARLPLAVGVGPGGASGAVPSPGTTLDVGESADDYLSRGMVYLPIPSPTDPAYQPVVSNPTLAKDTVGADPVNIIVSLVDVDGNDISDAHHVFFYSITSASTGFKEFPASRYVAVPITGPDAHHDLWAYASHAGMNNSAVVHIGPF